MMSDASMDFTHNFYNIEGDLISERKKNFRKFLQNPSYKEDAAKLHESLINLKPRNYLEGLFRVDALIHFKETEQLLEVMKDGNELYISKLLKQMWFLDKAFGSITVDELVNEFLPTMSATFKRKLIKKLCLLWTEEKLDALFDSLYNRYGLPLATSILHRCSPQKIKDVLHKLDIKFTASQEKHIYDRDPELFEKYTIHHKDILRKFDTKKVIDHIALHDLQYLLELRQKGLVDVRTLGRRTTKRTFTIIRKEITDNMNEYKKILKGPVIVRKLGKDFENIFEDMFPRNIATVYRMAYDTTYLELLFCYSKTKRWQLFYQTYRKKFPDTDFSKVLNEFNLDILQRLNADKQTINKWAEIHYEGHTRSEYYLPYFTDISKSVDLIKQKISVTSDGIERTRLLEYLVDACYNNEDFDELEKVLAYICKRHRNEDVHCKRQILLILESKTGKFDNRHWKYISELLKVFKIQGCGYELMQNMVNTYIEYLINNDEPIEEAVKEYLEEYYKRMHGLTVKIDDPKTFLKFIEELCEHYQNIMKERGQEEMFSFLCYVTDFCIANPEYSVDLNKYAYIVQYIQKLLKKVKIEQEDFIMMDKIIRYNSACCNKALAINGNDLTHFLSLSANIEEVDPPYSLFATMIRKRNRNNIENMIMELFWEKFCNKVSSGEKIVDWYLCNEPRTIVPYFNKVIEHDLMGEKSRKILKYYSHLGFDSKAYAYYNNKINCILNLGKDLYSASKYIEYLCKLSNIPEFLKIVNKCLPVKEKIDTQDDEMSEMFRLQVNILKFLHRVEEPNKVLPIIMQFSVGDYLQGALPALYSISHRAQEERVRPWLEQLLSKKAVSVRKHGLTLTTLVLDAPTVTMKLKNVKSDNTSENKRICLTRMKYFIRNPSLDLFYLCMDSLNLIDKNDDETFRALINMKVQRLYKVHYIERCWSFYEELECEEVKNERYLGDLVMKMLGDNIVAKLSNSFVQKLVQTYFKSKTGNIWNLERLVFEILFIRTSEQGQNLKLVFDIVKEWPNKKIYNFFYELANFQKNQPKNELKAFLSIFSDYWCKYFSLEERLQEHISLKILIYRHTSFSDEEFARNVIGCFDEMLVTFGNVILNIFVAGMKKITETFETADEYLLYLNILKSKCTPETFVLVVSSMKNVIRYCSDERLISVYEELIRFMGKVDDRICILYYQYYDILNT